MGARKKGRGTKAVTPAAANALVTTASSAVVALARRAEELLALIARRRKRIAEDFFEIGEALRELKKRKIYAAIDFESFGAMLAGRNVMGERTAEKLIEIVESMKREQAILLGPEKAYALARLVAASPDMTTVAEALARGAKIGGKTVGVDTLTVHEIEEAARKARPKRVDPQMKAASAAAREAQAALRARGAEHAIVSAVKRKGGAWLKAEVPVGEAAGLVARAAKARAGR